MVLSDISIQRPVLAIVVNALLVVFGIFAFSKLPVREYPAVDPPVVSIGTTYEGASAEVIESQITQVMEGAVSGIEGIKTIRSTSREGTSNVRIEFMLTRDIESAANDVRDRVSRAARNLPGRGGCSRGRQGGQRQLADPVGDPDQPAAQPA